VDHLQDFFNLEIAWKLLYYSGTQQPLTYK